jgi:hypothetical protein
MREPWFPSRGRPVLTRVLALVNVALIPYVWLRFPREARAYTRHAFAFLIFGRSARKPS